MAFDVYYIYLKCSLLLELSHTCNICVTVNKLSFTFYSDISTCFYCIVVFFMFKVYPRGVLRLVNNGDD